MGTNKDYIEWDVKNWSKALKYWQSMIDSDLKGKKCLELGGRRGGLSLWLAEKGAEVLCSDIENPLNEAKEFHDKYSFSGSISYQAIDATEIPYENEFDIIAFKSIIGGIARNKKDHMKTKVLKEIQKALKPGGKLLFAENLESSNLHQFLRKKFIRWGNEWNYFKFAELNSLFSCFDSFNYKTQGFLGAFGRKEWQRSMLAFFDELIFNRIISKKNRYIVFGVAGKKTTTNDLNLDKNS